MIQWFRDRLALFGKHDTETEALRPRTRENATFPFNVSNDIWPRVASVSLVAARLLCEQTVLLSALEFRH